MKTPIIAITASAAVFAALSSYAEAGTVSSRDVSVPYYGNQQSFNNHIQGQTNDQRDMIDHLQRSDTNHNAWTGRQQEQIDGQGERLTSLEGWTDRQEGAIRAINIGQDDQNRRLDAGDVRDQRQDGSIDNAHARIGGVIEQANEDRAVIDSNTDRSTGNQKAIGFLQETDTKLSEAIQQGQQAHAVTDKRSINNAGRLDGAEGAIRETNQQVTDDRTASVERDQSIAYRVDYNQQVNEAYQRQSAAQFEQHAAAIESNAQAITSEREARKQQGREANAGIASAAAIGQHHFDTNYHGFQLSVSGAGYRGEHAQSLSAGGAITDTIFGSVAVAHDSRGNQSYGIQSTFKF
ncbi:hypothetical protein [uncultured Kushneria sp.]|uniref:hypothetical protein n=1 Tax=uncultured Kushneria sp. TaxID=905033 RepID=UPI00261CA7F5|nr:hypothetical protein [uncultured Kushneria sp.]